MKSCITSPYSSNKISIRNRVFACPPTTKLSNSKGEITPELIALYSEMASSGIGGIITEGCSVSNSFKSSSKQLVVSEISSISNLLKLNDAIKKERALSFVQITHPGLQSLPDNRGLLFGPSAISNENISIQELHYTDIKKIINQFTNAAKIIYDSGFTGIEIQGADGDLIHQFLSPNLNKRVDKYGLNSPHQFLFALEIFKSIKKACPDIFIIWRIPLKDYTPGGVNLKISLKLAKELEQLGVDMFHVSGGIKNTREGTGGLLAITSPESIFKTESQILMNESNVPVILSGNIRTYHSANKLIANRFCDFVSLSREILRDRSWYPKALIDENAIKCLPCACCCFEDNKCPDNI